MRRLRRFLLVAALLGSATGAMAAEAKGPATPAEADRAAEYAVYRSVGVLGGSHAYSTFVALGAVGDCWVRATYGADKVIAVTIALERLAETAASALEAMLASGAVFEDDRAYVQGLVEAYLLLVAEAQGLAAWVRTGERSSFDVTREKAWGSIVLTLGRALGETLGRAPGETLGRAPGETLGRAPGETLGMPEEEALE